MTRPQTVSGRANDLLTGRVSFVLRQVDPGRRERLLTAFEKLPAWQEERSAIVSRSGRDLTALSAQASDAEVVLLPGVTLVPVPSPEGAVEGVRVHDLIGSRLRSARALSPVQVGAPGQFSALLPA